jgi:hypothetical protein
MEMPVHGLWSNYRFGNSFASRGVFPDSEYISRGFPATQWVTHYVFNNALRNAKSRINFFKKFSKPLDSHNEKN